MRAKREIALFLFKFPNSGIVNGHYRYNDAEQNKPVVLDGAARSDNKLSDGRQWLVAEHLVENRFELRHNEDEEKTQDAYRHGHHDDGIHHGCYDFVFDLGGLLLKFRKPSEHKLKHAADFAGFDHVDVQIVEDPRMQRERVGKCAAALHGIRDFVDRVFQHLVALLFRQDVQAP